MKFASDIILKPIVSEKSVFGVQQKQYTFFVAKDANKIEIKNAVEELFGVKVKAVNTINVPGKWRRMGAHEGKTAATKKAIVTLTAKSKTIEFFDNLM